VGWTIPKKLQLSIGSSFALQFYVILFVIWWRKKVCIRLKKYFTAVEKTHFFYISRSILGKYKKNRVVFWDFEHQYFIFMQNKRYIRNQHTKIHRKIYKSSKNNSRRNFTCRGPQGNFSKENWWGVPQVDFSQKNFLFKSNWFDVVFYADSEYDIYFAINSSYNGAKDQIATILSFDVSFLTLPDIRWLVFSFG